METCVICGNNFDIEKEGGIKSNKTKKVVCVLCMRENPKEVGRMMVK